MPSRRRSWPGLLAGLVIAAIVSGCGIDAGRGPVVDGDAPRAAANGNDSASWVPPKGPDGVTSETELVNRFFEAAAQPADALRTRIGEFFTDDARLQWYRALDTRQLGETTLVDISYAAQPKAGELRVTLMPVGKMNTYGSVEPIPGAPSTWIVLIAVTKNGPRIANLPTIPGILLARTAVVVDDSAKEKKDHYFTPRTIYFWDKTEQPSQRMLVPDLRYMPNWVAPAAQPQVVMGWLLNGPSAAILAVARPFPAASKLSGDEVTVDKLHGVQIQLTNDASLGYSGADMAVQIKWSLLDNLPSSNRVAVPVQVRIDNIATAYQASADRFLSANPLVGQRENPFVIEGDGKVVELAVNGDTRIDIPAVANGMNLGKVQSAGLSRDGAVGALVVRQPDGELRLTIGGRIGDTNPDYQATDLTGSKMSRPTFLGRGSRLLVVCDGQLYTVLGSNPQNVDKVTSPGLPPLTSVESAPDGKRIVLVTKDGGVLVATVADNGVLVLAGLSSVMVTDIGIGLTKVTAVAAGWASGTEILVAGYTGSNSPVLRRVSVDGVKRGDPTTSPDLQKITAINSVAVRPADALGSLNDYVTLIDVQAGSRGILRVFSQNLKPYPDPDESGKPASSSDYTAPFFAG